MIFNRVVVLAALLDSLPELLQYALRYVTVLLLLVLTLRVCNIDRKVCLLLLVRMTILRQRWVAVRQPGGSDGEI